MEKNNALTIRQASIIEEWQLDKELGEYAARAGIGNMYESALKAHVARELNISSAAALNGVYIIDGKPSIAPALAWALIVAHPEFDGYEEKRMTDSGGDFYGWEITMRRKNGVGATRRFTLEDARRIEYKAGKKLIDKDNWKNYPENVCYWRAMGYVEDVVWPDVTLGMKRSDELGADISPEGEVIDITPLTSPTNPQHKVQVESVKPVQEVFAEPTETIPQYGFTVAKLIEVATTEDINEVNGGSFPVTPEQVNFTVHKLIMAGKLELNNEPAAES